MTSQEIQAQVKKEIEDFNKTLKPDEIANSLEEFNPKKHKLILGNCNFEKRLDITDLGVLEMIGGDADFRDSKVENLGNLTTIGEYAIFNDSNVENLGNLTTIGGNAYFENSKIENLGNLTTVEGSINTNNNKLTRQQVIDHLNKMNQNFFVIRNSLYGIEKEWSDPIVSIKKGKNNVNLVSWKKLPLGKINRKNLHLNLNSDGTFGVQFKMYY